MNIAILETVRIGEVLEMKEYYLNVIKDDQK